jgi:hypothetical protein
MKFMNKWGLVLLPALALATPASAQLADTTQPGSVIIFPKFVNSLFAAGGSLLNVDGNAVSQTEIEIGAVCPPAFFNAGGACPEHQAIKIRFHWVCPGTEGVNSNFCPEMDFDVNLSVDGSSPSATALDQPIRQWFPQRMRTRLSDRVGDQCGD